MSERDLRGVATLKRALAVALVALLAAPIALAQQTTLRVELAPDHVATPPGVTTNATVRVHNDGMTPIIVALSAANATGGLNVTFDSTSISILPGASTATEARVRGNLTGEWQVKIVAQERNALGAPGPATSQAMLSVTIRANMSAPANTTTNQTAPPANDPPTSAVPPPPPSSEATPPPNDADAALAPAPPALPRASPGQLALTARGGTSVPFSVQVENPSDAAQRIEIMLHLPMGWTGSLEQLTLQIAPGGTGYARGSVTPTKQASDDSGWLELRAPGGSVPVQLALFVERATSVEGPADPTGDGLADPYVSDPWPMDAIDLTPTAKPATPSIRIVPQEVGARAGTSVLFTIYIANPGDTPLQGAALIEAAPLAVDLADALFYVAPGDEATLTFTLALPADVADGSYFDGVAATTLSDVGAPFRVSIESAEAPAPIAAQSDEAPVWLVALAAGSAVAGLALAGAWRRWPALGLLPLYARLAPRRALEHPRRRKMLSLLQAEPGLTLADVQRKLAMSNGVVRHHLALLEAAGAVRAVPDGALRRLWPMGEQPTAVPPLRERALVTIQTRGAMRASELADALGVSRQSLHYHLKRLVDEGRIVATRGDGELSLSVR